MSTVFLIDDDPVLGRVWSAYLGARWFTDAATALATCAEQPPAVIILDLILDGMGGISLLNELQSDTRLAAIPVIIASSLPPAGLGDAYGVRAVFDKATVTPTQLKAAVQHLLEPHAGA